MVQKVLINYRNHVLYSATHSHVVTPRIRHFKEDITVFHVYSNVYKTTDNTTGILALGVWSVCRRLNWCFEENAQR